MAVNNNIRTIRFSLNGPYTVHREAGGKGIVNDKYHKLVYRIINEFTDLCKL